MNCSWARANVAHVRQHACADAPRRTDGWNVSYQENTAAVRGRLRTVRIRGALLQRLNMTIDIDVAHGCSLATDGMRVEEQRLENGTDVAVMEEHRLGQEAAAGEAAAETCEATSEE